MFAQNIALPITMGYTEPAPFQAAPGQVVTLFLDDISFGADGQFRSAQAGPGDLPESLAGISVRITPAGGVEMQAPIFAVQQKRICGLRGLQAGDAGCLLTLVKAQIPFELPADLVLGDQKVYTLPLPALISIDVDGRRGRAIPLQPLPDNAHVLTTCDASWDTSSSSVCDRQVFHAWLGCDPGCSSHGRRKLICALLRSGADGPRRQERPRIARCSHDYGSDSEFPE